MVELHHVEMFIAKEAVFDIIVVLVKKVKGSIVLNSSHELCEGLLNYHPDFLRQLLA